MVDHKAFADQRLDRLRRVVGVGVRQTVDQTALTLLSVESYDDGVITQFLLDHHRDRREFLGDLPQLRIRLLDGTARVYAQRPYGSTGGMAASRIQWRLAIAFAPGLPPDLADLTVRVSDVIWFRHDHSAGRLEEYVRTQGPWQYTMLLG
jgi:hypothetical protein